jgi:hypothetical protein
MRLTFYTSSAKISIFFAQRGLTQAEEYATIVTSIDSFDLRI